MCAMRVLFSSACVIMSLEGRHLTLRGLNAPIDDHSVDKMFETTESFLNEKTPFSTTWDVRECQVPPLAVTWKCIRWALANKQALDEYNTQLHIRCPPRLSAIVRLVLRTFGPKCPTTVEA